MTITYTKLKSGDWGIRTSGERLSVGQSVTIRKKSGETKTEIVQHKIFEGANYCLYAIKAKPQYHSVCKCDEWGCCRPSCRCDSMCACNGGPVYGCLG